MNRFLQATLVAPLFLMAGLGLSACGGDACDDLADECAQCEGFDQATCDESVEATRAAAELLGGDAEEVCEAALTDFSCDDL